MKICFKIEHKYPPTLRISNYVSKIHSFSSLLLFLLLLFCVHCCINIKSYEINLCLLFCSINKNRACLGKKLLANTIPALKLNKVSYE